MSEEIEDFFEHHGIKGMKWGVRRTDPSGSSKKSAKEETEKKTEKIDRSSEDYSKAKTNKSKPISELSNKELEELNRRITLERTYKDLTATPSNPSKGESVKAAVQKYTNTFNVANAAFTTLTSPLGMAILYTLSDGKVGKNPLMSKSDKPKSPVAAAVQSVAEAATK